MKSLKEFFRPGARKQITAAAGDEVMAALSFPCELEIVAAAGDSKKPPSFSMLAYTGGPMVIAGWPYPVVVELSGLEIPGQKIPVRLQHDPNQGVGHTTKISIRENQLFAEGVISRDTESARDVSNSGKNGFPWQASISASAGEYEHVKEGQKVKANGRTFDGPLDHVTKSKLKEISVVDLGADDDTEVKIAAKNKTENTPPISRKDIKMGATLRELRACADEFVGSKILDKNQADTIVLAAAEAEEDVPALRERLFKAVQLKQVRATHQNNLGGAPGMDILLPEGAKPREVLQAAFMVLAGQQSAAEKTFKEKPQVLNAAAEIRATSFYDIAKRSLIMAGQPIPAGKHELIQAAFSTSDLANSMAGGLESTIRETFLSVPASAFTVGAKKNVRNFKTHNLIEICGAVGSSLDPVIPSTGELKHSSFADSKITHKAETRGRIFTISRQDLINDDLGVVEQIKTLIGFNSRRTINTNFWNVVKALTTFFSEARGNLMPSSTLSIDNLSLAIKAARNMKDADGNPVGAIPKFLVVSPANEFLGRQLVNSAEIRNAAAEAAYGTANPLSKQLELVVEPLLGTTFGGADGTWYVFLDPLIVPGVILSFLDGNETPIVEVSNADFNVLGISFRAYLDSGVDAGDYRGVIRATV